MTATMLTKIFYCLVFFLCTISFAAAQTNINGIIVDSLNGDPLPAVSIYLNGSQLGTTSNKQGAFTVALPSEAQELVVSALGYNIAVLNTADLIKKASGQFVIKLIRKNDVMGEVVVKSAAFKRVDNRAWKKTFLDSFIGTGSGAKECVIKNFDDIILKLSEKQDILKAQSDKTIEVINHWLGYKIYFDIEDCAINLNSGIFYNYGYTRFEDISNGSKKIAERRAAVYKGSLTHFLRALYNNTHNEQGFELRRAQVLPNTEKARVERLMKENKYNLNIPAEKLQIGSSSADSSSYYYKVYVRQTAEIIRPEGSLLNADSVFITDLEVCKELEFENYLLVTYKNKSSEQLRLHPILPALEQNQAYQNSLLSLTGGNSVFVFPNGRISPLKILFVQGSWHTFNTLKNMLPSDY